MSEEWHSIEDGLPDFKSVYTIYKVEGDREIRGTGHRLAIAMTNGGIYELWNGGYNHLKDKEKDYYFTVDDGERLFSPDADRRTVQRLKKWCAITHWMYVPLAPGWHEGEPPKEEDHDNL